MTNSYKKQYKTEICLSYQQSFFIQVLFFFQIRMWQNNKIVTKEKMISALIFLKRVWIK